MTDAMSETPSSLGALLHRRVELTPNREAFRYPDGTGGWLGVTWTEFEQTARILAAGLLALGLGYEQRVAIAASTRIEWIFADTAVSIAAGATTTIYPNTTKVDFDHIVRDSGSCILIAENSEQANKLTTEPDLVDQVRTIILMDGAGDGQHVLSWSDWLKLGTRHLAGHPTCVDDAMARINPQTLSTLIYTSGTTGLPKGVELTHSNWVYEGLAVKEMKIVDETDLQLLWLPLSHVFGKCLLACQFAIGFASAVDGRIPEIVPNLRKVQPTFMCGAPRIFEKVRNAVMANSKTVKGRISHWAFAVGRDSVPYRLADHPMPTSLAMRYRVADVLVFRKLKNVLGGNLKFFISGSAKLSSQVQRWFYSAGITVVEGYGLTETTAISFYNHQSRPRFGTVGAVVPGSEVKIAADGEVMIRGGGVMRGYHKDPELTAEVLEPDGWLHTGDIGFLDAEGNLTITDRKKDLLKTSGGKYVAPQKVESVIAANIPYVSQAVAVGDGRKYIAALVTLDRDSLLKWAQRHGKEQLSYAELSQLPEIHKSIERFMKRTNAHLEQWETVKKFAIIDHEFTVEEGGVTANMKIRRANIARKYADVVDSLYDE